MSPVRTAAHQRTENMISTGKLRGDGLKIRRLNDHNPLNYSSAIVPGRQALPESMIATIEVAKCRADNKAGRKETMNGSPGDDPVIDIVVHGRSVYSVDIDRMVAN